MGSAVFATNFRTQDIKRQANTSNSSSE